MLSASKFILKSSQNPYPFKSFGKFYELNKNKDKPTFFQYLDEHKDLHFNDDEQEIIPVEQRIFSAYSNTEFKKDISLQTLLDLATHIPQEQKVFPVTNVFVDMSPLNLQVKL